MAAALLNQLNTLMANMFSTGLLDDQFQQLMLQDGSAPDFISEVVTLFCEDGERIIGELAKLLDKPCVDFDKVDAFVHQLKGSSASVGAKRVKNTCVQFREFCQQKSKEVASRHWILRGMNSMICATSFRLCFSWSSRSRPFILNSKLEQQHGAACSDDDDAAPLKL